MSDAAVIEPPTSSIEGLEWIFVKGHDSGAVELAALEVRGSGRERHVLIPPGRFRPVGPDTVSLPSVDSLDF